MAGRLKLVRFVWLFLLKPLYGFPSGRYNSIDVIYYGLTPGEHMETLENYESLRDWDESEIALYLLNCSWCREEWWTPDRDGKCLRGHATRVRGITLEARCSTQT